MQESIRVFINYRVVDSAPTAARLAEDLTRSLGDDAVFLDHQSIEGGEEWPKLLREEVDRASVMLCLIGARWLSARDEETQQRFLDREDDWVRMEIVRAFERQIQVIPVLVDGASLPSAEALPGRLEQLLERQAVPLRTRSDWQHDVEGLLETLGVEPLAESSEAVDVGVPVLKRRSREAEGSAQHLPSRGWWSVFVGLVLALIVAYRFWPSPVSLSQGVDGKAIQWRFVDSNPSDPTEIGIQELLGPSSVWLLLASTQSASVPVTEQPDISDDDLRELEADLLALERITSDLGRYLEARAERVRAYEAFQASRAHGGGDRELLGAFREARSRSNEAESAVIDGLLELYPSGQVESLGSDFSQLVPLLQAKMDAAGIARDKILSRAVTLNLNGRQRFEDLAGLSARVSLASSRVVRGRAEVQEALSEFGGPVLRDAADIADTARELRGAVRAGMLGELQTRIEVAFDGFSKADRERVEAQGEMRLEDVEGALEQFLAGLVSGTDAGTFTQLVSCLEELEELELVLDDLPTSLSLVERATEAVQELAYGEFQPHIDHASAALRSWEQQLTLPGDAQVREAVNLAWNEGGGAAIAVEVHDLIRRATSIITFVEALRVLVQFERIPPPLSALESFDFSAKVAFEHNYLGYRAYYSASTIVVDDSVIEVTGDVAVQAHILIFAVVPPPPDGVGTLLPLTNNKVPGIENSLADLGLRAEERVRLVAIVLSLDGYTDELLKAGSGFEHVGRVVRRAR